MLDIRRIRENPEEIAKSVSRRGKTFCFDHLLAMVLIAAALLRKQKP